MKNGTNNGTTHTGPRRAGRSILEYRIKKLLIKPVSLVLIFTFSYSQLVWALDVRQMLLEAKASFEEDELRRSAVSPRRLEETQAAQQAEIDQQQALQELMSFKLTTRNGDILNYVGQTLKEVERPDGTRLKNITLDGQGRITGADLSLADGSVQILQGGEVVGYRLPNGTSVEYTAGTGKISKVLSPEGVISTYAYSDDGQGGELTTVTTGTKQALYGADGILRMLTDSATGTVTRFVNGHLSTVTVGGIEHRYVSETLSDGTVRVRAAGSLDPDAAYTFVDGRVTAESSGYSAITATATHTWTQGTAGTWYSGDGYLTAGPDLGNSYDSNISTATPRVDYKVRFDAPGTYYLWVRGYASNSGQDSVHAGLNGSAMFTKVNGFAYNTASWTRTRTNVSGYMTLNIATAGEHTVNFWMREDGFKLDKFVITSDAAYIPSGLGDAESQRLSILDVSSDFPSEVLYAADGSVLETRLADGSRLVFDGGLLKEAYDPQGQRTAFAFAQSSVYNITQSRITTDALEVTYAGDGRIGSLKVDGLTIHYKDGGTVIHYLEKEDGTEIYDPVFDAQGNLTGGEIVLPDGSVRFYEEGLLKIAREPDQTKVYYEDLKPVTLITPGKLTYHLDHTLADRIEATLDEDIVPSVDTIVRYEYDTQMNLRKAVRHNQEIISYLDDRVVSVEAPDEAPRVFAYQHDPGGALVSYTITQGNVVTHYDAQDRPTYSLIQPDAQHPDELEVLYQYGKIRQIKKNGAVTFTYSYRFEGGEEITEISDAEEDTLKTYKAERLLSSLDRKTTVLSTYAYGPGGNVSRVTVTRYGRTLHTYDYSYTGELTHVVDELGVRRTYDAGKKLTRLERDGLVWGYTYAPGSEGEEIAREQLLEKHLEDGSVVHYDGADITRVDRPDGSWIDDIRLDEARRIDRATLTLADGSKRIFNETAVLETIDPDGTHVYYDGERIRRVVTAAGAVLDYTYLVGGDSSGGYYDLSSFARDWQLVGEARIEPLETVSGAGSIRLDGATGYVRVPQEATLSPGTQDFAVEMWFKAEDTDGDQVLLSTMDLSNGSDGYGIKLKGRQLYAAVGGLSATLTPTEEVTARTWHHVALTRQGGTVRLFLDGQEIASRAWSAPVQVSRDLYVGRNHSEGNEQYFDGHVAQVRVSHGTARYTQDFGTPSERLTADAATALLLSSGTGLDQVHGLEITRDGVRYRYDLEGRLDGYYLGEEYFERTEGLVQYGDQSASQHALQYYGNAESRGTQPLFGLHAIEYDGSGDYVEIADHADWDLGSGDFTVDLWARPDTLSGKQHLIGTADIPGGGDGWALRLDGTTIQTVGMHNGSAWGWNISSASGLTSGQWAHLALTRQGNTLRLFVNGQLKGSATYTGSITSSRALRLGRNHNTTYPYDYRGGLSEVRVVSGQALYTQAYTPPTTTSQAVTGTRLLAHTYTESTPGLYYFQSAEGRMTVDPNGQTQEIVYFRDHADTHHALGFYGNLRATEDQSVYGGKGIVFDGSTGHIKLSDSSDWALGTGDLTLDAWIKPASNNTKQVLFSQGSWSNLTGGLTWALDLDNGQRMGVTSSGLYVTSATFPTLTLNTWHHVAVERKSGVWWFYLDGVRYAGNVGSGSGAASIPDAALDAYIGRQATGSTYAYKGVLDEFRLTRGLARYGGAAYTPPASAAVPDEHTKLLVHQYHITGGEEAPSHDRALYGLASRVSGALLEMIDAPHLERMNGTRQLAEDLVGTYRYGRLYEVHRSGQLEHRLRYEYAGGQRYVWDETGGRAYRYDGQGGLRGFQLDGHLYELSSGIAYYKDQSASALTHTLLGDAALSASASRYGQRGLALDGQGDALSLSASSALTLGTSDFTLEGWVKPNSSTKKMTLFSQGSWSNLTGGLTVMLDFETSTKRIGVSGAGFYALSQAITSPVAAGEWMHVAVQRQGGTMVFYFNGRRLSAATVYGNPASSLSPGSNTTYIGRTGDANYYLDGAIDELRLSSVARYGSADFAPAQTAHAPDAQTRLLLHEYRLEVPGSEVYSSANGHFVFSGSGELTASSLQTQGAAHTAFLQDAARYRATLEPRASLDKLLVEHPQLDAWYATALGSVLDAGQVVRQEYSTDGVLESQTKADGSVTLYEDDRPTLVLDDKGAVLVEYRYDASGHLERVYLRQARESLPERMRQASLSIREQEQQSLLALAQSKNLAVQSIREQSQQALAQIDPYLADLRGQLDALEGQDVRGKAAKKAKSQSLDQIREAIAQVEAQRGTVLAQESQAYASLHAEVAALAASIEADAQEAAAQLALQEQELQRQIVRQEVSPVIYDHYRRILGRDPSSAEYDAWAGRVEYELMTEVLGEEVRQSFEDTGSVYMDGSGDDLSMSDSSDWAWGNGDFTIDLWARWDQAPQPRQQLVSQYENSSNWWSFYYGNGGVLQFQKSDDLGSKNVEFYWTPQTGVWHHLAVVREGVQLWFYADGSLIGSADYTGVSFEDLDGRLYVGQKGNGSEYFKGHIEAVRLSRSALWSGAFSAPVDYLSQPDSTRVFLASEGNGGMVDVIDPSRQVVMTGSVVGTAVKKTRTLRSRTVQVTRTVDGPARVRVGDRIDQEWRSIGSLLLDGTGDHLEVADHADWDLGSSNFTIDLWVNMHQRAANRDGWIGQSSAGTGWALYWDSSNNIIFRHTSGGTIQANLSWSWVPAVDRWYHVALTRSGQDWVVYVDGRSLGARQSSASVALSSGALWIGRNAWSGDGYFNGRIEAPRLVRGVVRWTTDFTPSERYGDDTLSGELYVRPDGQGGWQDVSGRAHTVLAKGDAALDRNVSVTEVLTDVSVPIYEGLTTALVEHLESLPELAQRQAYVAQVRSSVRSALEAYVAMDGSDRAQYAATLGLGTDEIIPLTTTDAAAILEWLDAQSLHFGQSAFLSLEALLDQKGISYAREDIAVKTILVDVLSGVITPMDKDGDLLLSVHALRKVGSLYGLGSLALRLDWQDLVDAYRTDPSARIIAHINGVHYVVITGIDETAGTITYIDMGAGADKSNQTVTATQSDWLKVWEGDTLSSQEATLGVEARVSKELSLERMKEVRGSFFAFLIPMIAGFFSSIGGAIAAIVTQIGAMLSTIGQMVAGALQSVGGFLSGLGQHLSGAFTQVFQGIHWGVASLFSGLGKVLGGLAGSQLFGSLSGTLFGGSVFKTAVAVGLNFAVSKGLDALGVSPVITGLLSAFTTGGFLNALSAEAFSVGAWVAGGLKGLALESVQTLAVSAGLDSSLASALSLAAGQFTGGILSGNLAGEMVQIAQKLATNLSFYGVQKLGAMAGLDPRVSGLIGAPVSGALGAGLRGGTDVGLNIIEAVNDGLLRGAVSLGVEYITQRADLSPLLGALTTRAITGAIAGALGSENIFGGIFSGFKDSVLNVTRLGVSGNDPLSQTQYLQRVLSFSDIVLERGLAQAIEGSAAQIFNEDSISSILRSFSSIQAYIQDQIENNKTTVVIKDGTINNRIQLSDGSWVDLDEGKLNINELKIGSRTQRGIFGVDAYGNFGLIDGYMFGKLDETHTVRYDVSGGNTTDIRVYDVDGGVTFEIVAATGRSHIVYDGSGSLSNFAVNSYRNGSVSFEMNEGELTHYSSTSAIDDFDLLMPDELREMPSFEIERQQNGSYKTTMTRGMAVDRIFAKAGQAFPGIVEGVTFASNPAMVLASKLGQVQADATEQALIGRYNLFKNAGYEDWSAVGMATYFTVGDFIGYTPIAEAVTGFDTVTGEDLTNLERAGKLGIGILSAGGTAFSVLRAVEAAQFAPSFASGIRSFTSTILGFNELLGEVGSVRIGSMGVSQFVDESAVRLAGFKAIPANQLPAIYDPNFNLSAKTLYSAQSKLALDIGDQFYGGKNYLYAAEHINPTMTNPLTSNPTAIFNEYVEALNSGNMNAARIIQTKIGIMGGARKSFENGLITQSQLNSIEEMVAHATIQDFAPRMLKIEGVSLDATKVTGKLVDGHGSRSIEYVLRDTDKSIMTVIDQR
ncbi:MAG: hypothetical protein MOGMAGMI_02164 [Candidatus Omnitrophica bacterium]|nr:hypothetical protein [Candidatus Omnitrophota bacterium]